MGNRTESKNIIDIYINKPKYYLIFIMTVFVITYKQANMRQMVLRDGTANKSLGYRTTSFISLSA